MPCIVALHNPFALEPLLTLRRGGKPETAWNAAARGGGEGEGGRREMRGRREGWENMMSGEFLCIGERGGGEEERRRRTSGGSSDRSEQSEG